MATMDELIEQIRAKEEAIAKAEEELKGLPAQAKTLRQRIANLKKQRTAAVEQLRKALPTGIVRVRKPKAATPQTT